MAAETNMAANSTPETTIRSLTHGMTNEPRNPDPSHARIIKHFDIFSRPNALVPYRSTESGDSSASTNQIARFEFANNLLYGLSTASGLSQKLFTNAGTSGSSWNTPSGTNVADVPNGFLFMDYPDEGKLYWSLSAALASYTYGSSTYTAAARAITATAQGLVHSKSKIMYVPCTNVIASNNAGSWNNTALTLPSDLTISSLFEYGNYLGIACKPRNGFGRSKVYLWDQDSSLTTLSEIIDWDVSQLECVEVINGVLVGISTFTETSITRLQFRAWTPGRASADEPFLELTSSSVATTQRVWKQKVNSRLYFNYDITINGEQCIGIWALGKNALGQWAVALDHLYSADTSFTSDTINGFYLYSDYMFVSYNDNSNGNACTMSKTDDQATYSFNSTFASVIFHTFDSSQTKKLLGVTAMYEPLPAAGSVTLAERKDGATSWTTIFTDTTDNDISHSAIAYESSGNNFGEHQEREFQITSTGGAVITGFSFKEEWINKRPY